MADQGGDAAKVPTGQAQRTDPAADVAVLTSLVGENASSLGRTPLLTAAAAACLRYARATQPTGGLPIVGLRLYQPTDLDGFDDATKTNLELLQTLLERKRQGALSCGARSDENLHGRTTAAKLAAAAAARLGTDRSAPRCRRVAGRFRHASRQALREVLRSIHDIERLTGRLTTLLATDGTCFALATACGSCRD